MSILKDVQHNVISELQTKTVIKYYCIPIKTVKIQTTDNTKCRQGCEATETFIHHWWQFKICTVTLEGGLAVSYKTKHRLTI